MCLNQGLPKLICATFKTRVEGTLSWLTIMLKNVKNCVCSDGTPPKRHPSLNVGVQVALFCIVPQIALAMHKGSVKKGRREEVQFNSRSLIVYCEFVTSALLCSKIDRKTSQAPLLECMF